MTKNILLATSIVVLGMFYSAEGMNGLPNLITFMNTNSVSQFTAVKGTISEISTEQKDKLAENAAYGKNTIGKLDSVEDVYEETIWYLREIKYNEIYDKLNGDNCLEYVKNNSYIKFDNDKVVYIDSFFMDVLLDVVGDDKLSVECVNDIIVPAGKSLLTLWNKDNQKMNAVKLLRIIDALNEKELDDEEKIKVDQSFIEAIKADPAKFFL